MPFVVQANPLGYTGVWLNKDLYDSLVAGVEPKAALKYCGNPTAITFSGDNELLMSWNNHEGSYMLYKSLEDGSIETLGRTPNGIKIGMRYRITIQKQDEIEILSVKLLEPEAETQDALVRYPKDYGTDHAPRGMIISLFLAGDYTPAGHPDSTISITSDGRIKGWMMYNSLGVGYDCSEERSQNHVYFHLSEKPGRNPSGDSFVWELSGDTLSFHSYKWEDLLFNGTVGDEYLRLIRK